MLLPILEWAQHCVTSSNSAHWHACSAAGLWLLRRGKEPNDRDVRVRSDRYLRLHKLVYEITALFWIKFGG